MEAYDLEQRELVKPIEKKVKEVKVPGRDLKEDRSKRSVSINEDLISIPSVKDNNDKGSSSDANCFNDPFCDDKFSRDPASDSLADRDLTKFLKVGSSLLEAGGDGANNSEKII